MKKLIEEPSLIQSQTRITIECMKYYDFFFLSSINAVIHRETWVSTHSSQAGYHKYNFNEGAVGGEGGGISQLRGGTQTARCQLDLKDTGQRTAAPRALLSAT